MALPILKTVPRAFFPINETSALTVGTASTNVAIPATNGGLQAVLANVGTNVIYVALGTDNTIAAVVPVAGTPSFGFPLLPNTTMTIHTGSATYIAAIAAATGNTLFITAGNG